MKNNFFKKTLSVILCTVSVAAMILSSTGCSKQQETNNNVAKETYETTTIGEGSHSFLFKVTGPEGSDANFEVHSDAEYVGEALIELGLIDGEPGDYGLYVKTVNGVTVDYDKDGKYWAFYVDGEYAVSGVDTTLIEDGKTYEFKAE